MYFTTQKIQYIMFYCALLIIKHASSEPQPFVASSPMQNMSEIFDPTTSTTTQMPTILAPQIATPNLLTPNLQEQEEESPFMSDLFEKFLSLTLNETSLLLPPPTPPTPPPPKVQTDNKIDKNAEEGTIPVTPLDIPQPKMNTNITNITLEEILKDAKKEVEWSGDIIPRIDRSSPNAKKDEVQMQVPENSTDEEISTTTSGPQSETPSDEASENTKVEVTAAEVEDKVSDDESTQSLSLPPPLPSHDGDNDVSDGTLAEDAENYPSTNIEISQFVARKLCIHLKEKYNPTKGRSGRSYLWAPIYQYAPVLERGFPLAVPEFTPDCMKWRLKICNGTEIFPLMTPCTFWAPMPLKSPGCLFSEETDDASTTFVNYRPADYNETYCPCRWPCTPYFDKIQKCKVNRTQALVNATMMSEEALDSDGTIQLHSVQIPHYQAMQLCRGMHQFLENSFPVKIDSIPIRIISLSKERDSTKDCITWRYSPCKSSGKIVNMKEVVVKKAELLQHSQNATDVEAGPSSPGLEESTRRRRKRDDSSGDAENELSNSEASCGGWEQVEIEDPDCSPQVVAGKTSSSKKKELSVSDSVAATSDSIPPQKVPTCPGGQWPCFLHTSNQQKNEGFATKNAPHFSTYEKGPGCNCNWPCLPFFDPINKCYNAEGDLLVDANGKPIILPRRFSRTQKQLVLCLSYLDKDDIDCFIKK